MKKENKQFPSAEVGIEQIEDYVILKSKEMKYFWKFVQI